MLIGKPAGLSSLGIPLGRVLLQSFRTERSCPPQQQALEVPKSGMVILKQVLIPSPALGVSALHAWLSRKASRSPEAWER